MTDGTDMDLRASLLLPRNNGRFRARGSGRAERAFAPSVADLRVAPDGVLPVQYFGLLQPRFSAGAEGRLLLAVLEDAIRCYLKNMNRTGRSAVVQFREVNGWFNARNCHDLFAFESICEVFGIDPGWLRSGLRALRAEGNAGASIAHPIWYGGLVARKKFRPTRTLLKRPIGRRAQV
jgi:hypothetical protein